MSIGKDQKENMKAFTFYLDSHPPKHAMKKVEAMPGNQMTGLQASGLTTLWLQLLDGHGRELILRG